jgi:hypothetical protein
MFMVIYREDSLPIIVMAIVRAQGKFRIIPRVTLQGWYVLLKIPTDTVKEQ